MNEENRRLKVSETFNNRYLINSIIGKGGMGTVYLAEDVRLKGKLWAIKEIILKEGSYQNFIDEAKLLVSLDHPYLPNIVDYYPPNEDGYSYLVMDYISGKTLQKVFEEANRQLDYDKVIKYGLQICEILDYLHNKQSEPIIYRDLKPTNIMIDDQDNVRLVDFGVARRYKKGKYIDTVKMGTVGFAAPEQFEDKQTDQRTDIFSLGALLYYLLSYGQLYFSSQSPLNQIRGDLPHDLVWMIKRMLMTNPDERYQNILEVGKEIEDIIAKDDLIIEATELITKPGLSKYTQFEATIQKNTPIIPHKLILITNLSKRAGSTFIALNLAKKITSMQIPTSIIEMPFSPYIFDYIGMEQRLAISNKCFFSFPHAIFHGEKIEREKEIVEDNIRWLIPDPRLEVLNCDNWTYHHMMKLLYSTRGSSITIIDVGGHFEHDSVEPLFSEADLIITVIDPMPSEIMQNRINLQHFITKKMEGAPIEFVVNNWTKGIKKGELFDAIGVKPIALIPSIDSAHIHRAVYNCNIPYSYEEVREKLESELEAILQRILPMEFQMQRQKEQKTNRILWVKNLLKKG